MLAKAGEIGLDNLFSNQSAEKAFPTRRKLYLPHSLGYAK
jgi:hypothetical protein